MTLQRLADLINAVINVCSAVVPRIVLMNGVIVVVVDCQSPADFVQAMQIVEDTELEIMVLVAIVAEESTVCWIKLLRFGGGDGDVLVVEEVLPGSVDCGARGPDVLGFGRGEWGVIELLGGGVEEEVVGEVLLDDFERQGGICGDWMNG